MGVCPSSLLVGRESEFRIRGAVPRVGDAVGRPTRRRERRHVAPPPPGDGDENRAQGATRLSPLQCSHGPNCQPRPQGRPQVGRGIVGAALWEDATSVKGQSGMARREAWTREERSVKVLLKVCVSIKIHNKLSLSLFFFFSLLCFESASRRSRWHFQYPLDNLITF